MRKYIEQHLSAITLFIIKAIVIILCVLLFIFTCKALTIKNNDKYLQNIATILSIILVPLVQNYFFNKQNDKNIELSNKQYIDNINAGFSQRLYIYQYDEMKSLNEYLFKFHRNITKINNKMNELSRSLNVIWGDIPAGFDIRSINYDLSEDEIKNQMDAIFSLSLNSIENIKDMDSSVKLSEITNKSNLIKFIQGLEQNINILKQGCENIPINMNSSYYKDKKSRDDNIDSLLKNINMSIHNIENIYWQCVNEINNLKSNIRRERMKK